MTKNTENETTTIRVSFSTKAELDKRKIHERQPYDEVIQGLLNKTSEEAA